MGQPIKIYVGNIPPSARNSELKELFEKFGKVVECDILKEFAFVHMDDTNDAKAAIAGLNDSLWKGARIRVELSTTKTSKGEPSMRHRMASDDLARSLRRRSHDRDRRGSPPYMRGRDGRGYDSRYGAVPYSRSGDMRGPIRDSRYGPPPRSRPYPDAYDRRGYPESRGPLAPRGGYPPDYSFHPSSYRDPIRDHRGPPYPDPYGRQPIGSHYGQPMPYYRGPPQMGSASRYDYPPQGYPSSRPSRYSPPPPSRDLYREKDYRGLSPRDSSRDQSFNGTHRDRHMSPSKSRSRRHHSSVSPSPSPINKRNGYHKQERNASYSRSPSPLPRRNGNHKTANDRSSSRSQSPKGTYANRYQHEDASSSRSPSPVVTKTRHSRSRKSKENGKSKKATSSAGSESNNSSLNDSNTRSSAKANGHSKSLKKSTKTKRAATSSPSRSRSRSSIRSTGVKA